MDTITVATPGFGKRARKAVWITALLVGTLGFCNGCGTVRNLASGDPDIYGGIHKDVTFMMTPDAMPMTDSNGGPIFAAIVAADAGLSIIADTVTLPLVIRMKQNKNGRKESRACVDRDPVKPQVEP